jgi:signal transduction histidine kinase
VSFLAAVAERHVAYAGLLRGDRVVEEVPNLRLGTLDAILAHFRIAEAGLAADIRHATRLRRVAHVLGRPVRIYALAVDRVDEDERILTVRDVTQAGYRSAVWDRYPEPLAAVTPAGVYYYVNPAFQARLGLAGSAVLGRRVEDIVGVAGPGEATSGRDRQRAALAAGVPHQSVFTWRRPDGEVLSYDLVSLPLWEGEFLLGAQLLYRDRRPLEDEVRRSQEEALALTTAAMAHELRNPAQVVLGFLQLAVQRTEGEVREWLEVAAEECRRLTRILDDLLLVARRAPTEIRRVDVGRLVADVVDRLGRRHPTLILRVRVEGPGGVVETDPEMLAGIATHLLENALEAEGASEVVVRVTDEAIEVRDNGRGIPPEAWGRLFEPFFTTKGAGSGLGLYVAKRYAEAIGAEIEVENDNGAVFTVRLRARAHS